MALRQLQDEVPRVPNEAPAGLEQLLLETREMLPRPARGVRAANDPVGWPPRGSIPLPLGGLDGARPEIVL